jgi:hypothetical protein
MSAGTGFQRKQPTGWFAAGREVRCALELLSDATFKLFVWLCLHAERGRGALSATPAELARALGKKESDMHLALEELGLFSTPREPSSRSPSSVAKSFLAEQFCKFSSSTLCITLY